MKVFLWMLLFFSCFFEINAFAVTPKLSKEVVYTDPNKSIRVSAKNPEIVLTLQSNATTGFSWFLLRSPERFIKFVSHRFVAPNSKLIGAPGHEVWTFKAMPAAFVAPRVIRITMLYAQPWSLSGAQKTKFYIATESN